MIEQEPLFPFGIQITEPYTTLSDLFVSAVGFYAWYQMRKQPRKGDFQRYMQLYFLLMGVSTLMGSFFAHAFLHIYGHIQKVPGWLVGMVGIYFLERASIARRSGDLRLATQELLKKTVLIKLLLLLGITIWTRHLGGVGAQSLLALFAVVLPLHFVPWKKYKLATDTYFLYAIVGSVLMFIVSAAKWSIHPNFNFNDISHVVMAVCIYFFLQGALLYEEE